MRDDVERARVQAGCEWIFKKEQRDAEEFGLARPLETVALQRAQVIGVPEFLAKLLEDLPVAAFALIAERVA